MYQKFVELVQKNGLTVYKVAQETGISNSTLSDWKHGKSTPKSDKLIKIANYFGVSIEYFFSNTEKR